MLNGFYFKNNHYVIALKDVLKFRLLPVRIVGTCQVEGLDGAWSQYWNHDCRLKMCLNKLLMALLLLAMVVWLVGDSKMKIWVLFEGRGVSQSAELQPRCPVQ